MTAVTFHWFLYIYIFFSFPVSLSDCLIHSTWISDFIESADSPGLAAAYVMRQDTLSFKIAFPAVIVFFFLLCSPPWFSFCQIDNLLTGVTVHQSPLRFWWHLALDMVRYSRHFQVLYRSPLLSISFALSLGSLWLNFVFRKWKKAAVNWPFHDHGCPKPQAKFPTLQTGGLAPPVFPKRSSFYGLVPSGNSLSTTCT